MPFELPIEGDFEKGLRKVVGAFGQLKKTFDFFAAYYLTMVVN